MTDRNQVAAAALQSGGAATPRGAGQGAVSTAHLAMVHPAVYDAVDAVVGCHEPYVSSPAAKRRCGIATGEAAATEMLAARAGDGRFGPFRFLESSLPGDSLDPDARPDGGGRVLGVRPNTTATMASIIRSVASGQGRHPGRP